MVDQIKVDSGVPWNWRCPSHLCQIAPHSHSTCAHCAVDSDHYLSMTLNAKCKVNPVKSCALLYCWRCFSQKMSLYTFSSEVKWCDVSLNVFHPQSIDPESVESMQRECSTWISKLKSSNFFPSYLTLRHIHITWSPLTEEVIWSHEVLYSVYSSSIRGELRHQILHRLLRKS